MAGVEAGGGGGAALEARGGAVSVKIGVVSSGGDVAPAQGADSCAVLVSVVL